MVNDISVTFCTDKLIWKKENMDPDLEAVNTLFNFDPSCYEIRASQNLAAIKCQMQTFPHDTVDSTTTDSIENGTNMAPVEQFLLSSFGGMISSYVEGSRHQPKAVTAKRKGCSGSSKEKIKRLRNGKTISTLAAHVSSLANDSKYVDVQEVCQNMAIASSGFKGSDSCLSSSKKRVDKTSRKLIKKNNKIKPCDPNGKVYSAIQLSNHNTAISSSMNNGINSGSTNLIVNKLLPRPLFSNNIDDPGQESDADYRVADGLQNVQDYNSRMTAVIMGNQTLLDDSGNMNNFQQNNANTFQRPCSGKLAELENPNTGNNHSLINKNISEAEGKISSFRVKAGDNNYKSTKELFETCVSGDSYDYSVCHFPAASLTSTGSGNCNARSSPALGNQSSYCSIVTPKSTEFESECLEDNYVSLPFSSSFGINSSVAQIQMVGADDFSENPRNVFCQTESQIPRNVDEVTDTHSRSFTILSSLIHDICPLDIIPTITIDSDEGKTDKRHKINLISDSSATILSNKKSKTKIPHRSGFETVALSTNNVEPQNSFAVPIYDSANHHSDGDQSQSPKSQQEKSEPVEFSSSYLSQKNIFNPTSCINHVSPISSPEVLAAETGSQSKSSHDTQIGESFDNSIGHSKEHNLVSSNSGNDKPQTFFCSSLLPELGDGCTPKCKAMESILSNRIDLQCHHKEDQSSLSAANAVNEKFANYKNGVHIGCVDDYLPIKSCYSTLKPSFGRFSYDGQQSFVSRYCASSFISGTDVSWSLQAPLTSSGGPSENRKQNSNCGSASENDILSSYDRSVLCKKCSVLFPPLNCNSRNLGITKIDQGIDFECKPGYARTDTSSQFSHYFLQEGISINKYSSRPLTSSNNSEQLQGYGTSDGFLPFMTDSSEYHNCTLPTESEIARKSSTPYSSKSQIESINKTEVDGCDINHLIVLQNKIKALERTVESLLTKETESTKCNINVSQAHLPQDVGADCCDNETTIHVAGHIGTKIILRGIDRIIVEGGNRCSRKMCKVDCDSANSIRNSAVASKP